MLKFDLQLKICQTTHFDKVNYICFKNLDNNAFQRFMPKICPNMPNMPKISSIMDRTIFKIIKVQILDIKFLEFFFWTPALWAAGSYEFRSVGQYVRTCVRLSRTFLRIDSKDLLETLHEGRGV